MAASPVQPSELTIGDLREYRSDILESLLAEQAAYWNRHLHWDFSTSKETLLRYIDSRNLYGFVLLKDFAPIGYSYFIHENHKAQLGDLFVSEAHRESYAERILLNHTLRTAVVFPGVRRIEGQLLALSDDLPEMEVYGSRVRVIPRLFMILEGLPAARPRSPSTGLIYRIWTERDLESTSDLICRAYQHHVDARINDQYQSGRTPLSAQQHAASRMWSVLPQGCSSRVRPSDEHGGRRLSGKLGAAQDRPHHTALRRPSIPLFRRWSGTARSGA